MPIDRISSSNPSMTFNSDTVRAKENESQQVEKDKQIVKNTEDFEFNPSKGKDNLSEIVERLNKSLEPNNTSIKFELHDKLQEYYVTVVDQKTQEVIREIPSKKLLDIHAAMTEFMGLFVDKKI